MREFSYALVHARCVALEVSYRNAPLSFSATCDRYSSCTIESSHLLTMKYRNEYDFVAPRMLAPFLSFEFLASIVDQDEHTCHRAWDSRIPSSIHDGTAPVVLREFMLGGET